MPDAEIHSRFSFSALVGPVAVGTWVVHECSAVQQLRHHHLTLRSHSCTQGRALDCFSGTQQLTAAAVSMSYQRVLGPSDNMGNWRFFAPQSFNTVIYACPRVCACGLSSDGFTLLLSPLSGLFIVIVKHVPILSNLYSNGSRSYL